MALKDICMAWSRRVPTWLRATLPFFDATILKAHLTEHSSGTHSPTSHLSLLRNSILCCSPSQPCAQSSWHTHVLKEDPIDAIFPSGHDTSGFMPTCLTATHFLSRDMVAQGPNCVASHTAILCWAFFAVLHHCIVHNLDATHVLNEDAICPSGT